MSVETPEWVVKLEKKRDEVFKGRRLGHESGAGAPCNVCGSGCPGLDLHFWRKVCRNCRCRKDQHEVTDDDWSGWAQFEILGQQRSEPAFIKIEKIADNPVKVDWVPPDVSPDIATDYMNDLGSQNIPVEGSEAALKRRQQLEYQVPPHDLDPSLCHNLTEIETAQLQKYVEKIKESCVGQGNVIRVAGGGEPPQLSYIENIFHTASPINEMIVKDEMLTYVLKSDIIRGVLQTPATALKKEGAKIISECRPMTPDFMESPLLSDKNRYKLKQMRMNSQALQSGVLNGQTYDNLFRELENRNINFSEDNLLGPMQNFRKEYRQNDRFKTDVDNFVNSLGNEFLDSYKLDEDTLKLTDEAGKPIMQAASDDFQSPLPIRPFAEMRLGRLTQQETPVRKLKFGKSSEVPPIHALASYDKIFPSIAQSPLVESLIASPALSSGTDLITNSTPLIPDFDASQMNPSTEQKLKNLMLDGAAVRSGVVNGAQYDDLFRNLRKKKVRFGKDTILGPMEVFRDEYLSNDTFRDDVNNYTLATAHQMMSNPNSNPFLLGIIPSQSSDSGFGSVPPTPNFSSHPGEASDSADSDVKVPVLKCKQCFLDIFSGDVAVKADRAGKSVAWHPKCFVCHKCQELLADLVYFFHGGNVYCARDLAIILNIPRCAACDELIFMKEYTVAEGSTFHIKHFCCNQCDQPLAGQKYVPDDITGMPLCLKCFDEFHAEKCSRCQKAIGPAEQGVSWGKIHWHGNCFACSGLNCGKSLIGQRFCVKNDIPFCSPACVKSINL
ncbi:testin [Sergentomyia squamirostris]